ncbi:hypothetical protein MLD38_017574 [Melastoma candidum]|uniref:Uncharacterized protein n=1 Tax=Melastoma candidum TaxID=119954 RepID=A0ACB9QQH8_9MYRT|nr:hypothetical protein MLD38_017574 [Melastoma candidum]
MLPSRFSIFGDSRRNPSDSQLRRAKSELATPTLKLRADKEVYRPGDEVIVTVDVCSPEGPSSVVKNWESFSLLVKRLGFEIRGIEKLDTQWFATQKPSTDSKQRRGETVFMDGSAPVIFSNQIVSCGTIKSYVIRTALPKVIPPSYRGATIRYLYYVKCKISAQWKILESGPSQRDLVKDLPEVDARIPLKLWVDQKNSGLQCEEGQSDGIVPSSTVQLDIYWKEMDGESEWVKANDVYDGVEEGYDSSRDEVLSVSSFNPSRENLNRAFGSSLSLLSSTARSSSRDALLLDGERPGLSLNVPLPRLSASEVLQDNNDVVFATDKATQPLALLSPRQAPKLTKSLSTDNDEGNISSLAGESFVRARSYNIRLDDRVLLRFSPKDSESTYYFGDTIGGTLTFFHEQGARRCLEVSITLETSETIKRQFLHPSRRNTPTITKVQSDRHEVVADLMQTSFLFTIPIDGPMSFCTPHISVQWSLRFEFFTAPKNVDWTRYEHPLLVEGRDKKSLWVHS